MRNPDHRRGRLKDWLTTHPIPPAEKSYISQLLSGSAPFGEKAANRIEELLGMPTFYLDTAGNTEHDEHTTAVIKMMDETDTDGKIRAKHAVIDALHAYRLLKSEQIPKIGTLPDSIIQKLASIDDPELVPTLEGILSGFIIETHLKSAK